MHSNKKPQKESADWRFMLAQIGRELRKVYERPERLPRRLRAAVTQLIVSAGRHRAKGNDPSSSAHRRLF